MAISKLQLSQLLTTYGELLTDKQREAVSMYCDCDCTLSEIADEAGISRQGVRDAIIKAESSLVKLEDALRLSKFIKDVNVALQKGCDVTEIVKRFVSKE